MYPVERMTEDDDVTVAEELELVYPVDDEEELELVEPDKGLGPRVKHSAGRGLGSLNPSGGTTLSS